MDNLGIRESGQADIAAIEALYPEAFPDEDLVPLVRDLLRDPEVAVSLVGAIDRRLVAHVVFTKCGVGESGIKASLLGPLAVAPAWQRQGIGSAIVRAGLRRLESSGVNLVCVLGDPAYYSRLGFAPETLVEPPFRLPDEWQGAWQSRYLGDTVRSCAGKLAVPSQWLQPSLWAP